MDTQKSIQLKINSCYEHISLVSQGIMAMVRRYHQAPELLGCIELCLVEVANNTVEHSYNDQKNHSITFEVTLSAKEISLIIIDSGNSMPIGVMGKNIDWDNLDKDNVSSWTTSGRGLQIVKDLMDEVSYRTESGFNYFKMVKKIP